MPPRALEDRRHEQHRHIAAHAVALVGNRCHGVDHRLAQPRMKGVELEHIRPRRKVTDPSRARTPCRRPGKIRPASVPDRRAALNEVFRMIGDPGMVRRHVVGNEIEDQPHAPLGQLRLAAGEPVRSAQMLIHDVAAHAIGRADIVLRGEVRKGPPEILEQSLVPHGDRDPGRAPLPHAHEPDRVKAVSSQWHPIPAPEPWQSHRLPVFPAQFTAARPRC